MKPGNLFVRCYAEKENDYWVGVCLDFSLAVQADTLEEVQTKLGAMVAEHVYDAIEGEDKAHMHALLARRAPLQYWVKYYAIKAILMVHKFRDDIRVLFEVPVTRNCRHA